MRLLAPLTLLLVATSACDPEGPDITRVDPVDNPDAPIAAETRTDRHSQVGVPAVDVLWVVDNSRSMFEEQQALSNNFTSFMRYFEEAGMDYHIAVTTTGWDSDEERGKLRTSTDARGNSIQFIDADVRDPEVAFREMALIGTDGPMDEKGRAQVYSALEINLDDNYEFLRDDAFLSVIVLSDEDDFSGDVPIGHDPFVSWLENLKGEPGKVSFSSIVGPDGGCGNAEEGSEYLSITRAIGGVEHSICDPSWANVLESLGMQAAGLRSEFALSALPDVETIQVTGKLNREEIEYSERYDWVYVRQRNSIQFINEIPAPDTQLTITYDVAKTGDPQD